MRIILLIITRFNIVDKDDGDMENQISNQTLFEKFMDYDNEAFSSKLMQDEISENGSKSNPHQEYQVRKKRSQEFKHAQFYITVAEQKAKENMELEIDNGKAERRTILDDTGRYLTRSRADKTEIREISKNLKSARKTSLGVKRKISKRGKKNLKKTRSSSRNRYYKTRVKNIKVRKRKAHKQRMKGTKDYDHEEQNKKIRALKKNTTYQSEIEKALAVLQENAIPKRILCREDEKSTMTNFIKEGINEEGCSQCLCKIPKKIFLLFFRYFGCSWIRKDSLLDGSYRGFQKIESG